MKSVNLRFVAAVLLVVIIVVVGVIFFAGYKSSHASDATYPKLLISDNHAAQTLLFGEVDAGRQIEHRFDIQNDASRTLHLLGATVSCSSCTKLLEMSSEIEPGQTGHVKIRLDTTSKRGVTESNVAVRTDDPQRPVIALKLKGTTRAVWIEPEYVELKQSKEGWRGTGRVFAAGYERPILHDSSGSPGLNVTTMKGRSLASDPGTNPRLIGWIDVRSDGVSSVDCTRLVSVKVQTERGERTCQANVIGGKRPEAHARAE